LTLLVPEQNSEMDTPGGFNVLDLVESGSFRSCDETTRRRSGIRTRGFTRLLRGGPLAGMIAAVRWKLVSVGLTVAGVGCGLVAFLERHVSTSSLPNVAIEGAYFNRSVGPPSFTSVLYAKGDWFDPFRFSVPYLWLGLAVGLAIGAGAVVVVSRGSS
jgi:hypothetical protein